MLNSLPSKRYLTGKPASHSWKSVCKHGREHHAEQCRYTALLDSICHHYSEPVQACHHETVTPLLWTCVDSKNFTVIFQSPSRLIVKCFGEVYNVHAEVHVLLLTFLLELPGEKILFIFVLYISLGVACPSWIHADFLLEVQPDLNAHSGGGFSRIFASIVLAIDNREMPLRLSQTWSFSFRLYNV